MICGIDEAGRGPLAGPVTAAAVVLPAGFPVGLLNDSKQMSPQARKRVSAIILSHAAAYGTGWVSHWEIDRLNIHHASLLAMQRAFDDLFKVFPGMTIAKVLVDGKFCPHLSCETEAIIKGDTKIPEIQAASILAKEARDRWMIRYSWIENAWGFEKHKGYPTRDHRDMCRELGLSVIHRRTFRTGN